MNPIEQKAALDKVKDINRFNHALRGLHVFWKATRNLPIHLGVSILVIILGLCFRVSGLEWIVLTLAMGLVFVTEALNTAIEIDIDLTSPQYHPFARDTKDVAAGAVLLSALCALIVGLIVFVPKILIMLQ